MFGQMQATFAFLHDGLHAGHVVNRDEEEFQTSKTINDLNEAKEIVIRSKNMSNIIKEKYAHFLYSVGLGS